ncbi:hypothetical protein ACFL9T_18515 [Thermodesulfobacteriota bacterium]
MKVKKTLPITTSFVHHRQWRLENNFMGQGFVQKYKKATGFGEFIAST